MDFEEIKKLLKLLEDSNLKRLHVKEGDKEIELEKESHYSITKMPSQYSFESHNGTEASYDKSLDSEVCVTSPMVGTYYSRPSPDQQSYIKEGDVVNEDTVVCVIEAMKVMNEVKAGIKGVIKKTLIQDAHPVEFGTKLFVIE